MPTPNNIKNLTEKKIKTLLISIKESDIDEEEASEELDRVVLMKCASCSKSESYIREFNSCKRFKAVYYLSRRCQKKHWKAHKKVCNNN